MGSLGIQAWQWAAAIGAAVLMAVGAVLAPAALKERLARLRWWLLGVGAIALAWLFLVFLGRRLPPDRFPPSALPAEFRPGYWRWMYLFLIGALASAVGIFVQIRAARAVAGDAAEGGGHPDIDAAWAEILLRLDQAKIAAAEQRVFLVLAPSEADAAAFVESAGLNVFAQGPAAESPIHAFATSDGVFLSLAGASHFGAPGNPEATARIEHVARLVRALNPDCPPVRALAVVLPMDWCSRPESIKHAASVRDDLLALRRILDVRSPSFAIFSGMESVPGFLDFANRLGAQVSKQMLDQRVGFAIPASQEFGGELVQRGLIWQSGWFHVWALNLLAGDPLNYPVNAELVTLEAEFRRYRRRLRALLEAAFSSHQGAGPVLFRGCYFVASGATRAERAFAAGLLRGARSRIVSDGEVAGWTEEAERSDRRYYHASMAVGATGLAACLAVWAFIAPRLPTLGWIGFAALAAVWFAASIRWLRMR